jgi:hypothetical protein
MHLNINQGQGSTWNLIWEEYEGFAVVNYLIYRGTSISNLALIGSTAGGNTSFSDISAPSGDIFYQIAVTPPSSCSSLKSTDISSSRSNIASNTVLNISKLTDNVFSVYPMPVVDELFLNIRPLTNPLAIVSSTDGRIFMNCKLKSDENKIIVGSLPKGMYILRIMDSNQAFVAKFIKE